MAESEGYAGVGGYSDVGDAANPEGAARPAAPESAGGSDFVVVANRLPVDMQKTADGVEWRRSPGGLVTALEPILRSGQGAWVGWPGVADADVEPFEDDGLRLVPVPLSAEEVENYYEGFSNATLWPLYHDVIVRPIYHRHWWNSYVEVNRRFAERTAAVAAPGATVWIQDYQLQLVPKMLRKLRKDLTIGFFLHIPLPPVELFMQLPWRSEIVEGLLGADLVGFHLPGGAQNFLILAKRLGGYTVSKSAITRSKPGIVQVGFRFVHVGAFPISIDSGSMDEMSRSRATRERAKQIRKELGNPKKILLGIDRLDYTKGIDVRLAAFQELLEEGELDPADTVMLQVATPSRERVESYRVLRGEIEGRIGRINGDFGEIGRPAVHYIHRPIPRDDLIAFFVAADVMVVTPLRDGMNLVAKEYVACRSDLGGALVLSEFTGAAAELRQAYLCNPHDLNSVKDALVRAVRQDREFGRRTMRAMRRQVLTHDVDLWARSFLSALARSRGQGTEAHLTAQPADPSLPAGIEYAAPIEVVDYVDEPATVGRGSEAGER